MPGSLWVELREFISRLRMAEETLRRAERDTRALRDELRDTWAQPLAMVPPISATIAGGVGVCGPSVPNILVTVRNPATGIPIGTATTDAAGHYSMALSLDTDPQSIEVMGSAPIAPTYHRVTDGSWVGYSIHSGSNTGINANLTRDPAWYCNGGIAYPIAPTLTMVDPQYGTVSIVSGSNLTPWTHSFGAVTFPVSGTCPGATGNLSMSFSWDGSGPVVGWNYPGVGPGGCPATGGSLQTANTSGSSGVFASQPGPTAKLDWSVTLPAGSGLANRFYAGAATTIRVFEP